MQAVAMQSNNEPMLSVSEVSKLKGCGVRHIQILVKQGRIEHLEGKTSTGRPQFLIPLSALDAKAQRMYHKANGGGKVIGLPPQEAKSLDSYSESERSQIHFWSKLIEEWQAYRRDHSQDKRTDADSKFVVYAGVAYVREYRQLYDRDFDLTTDTLYRRWRAYKDNDLDGLIEKRGKAKKGTTAMPEIVWDAFLSFYLDQREFSIEKCREYTQLWVKESMPELFDNIPHYSSFYRRIQSDIPEPLKVLGREGEKAYRDRCAPYIKRVYDDMESNDYWIADTHTFDVMSQGEEGKPRRLYLTAFFDARAGIFTGCTITETPGSQAVLNALRKGIFKYGIPRYIYVDNGREFLTYDLGGLGHRKKKRKVEVYEPPAIFQRLGITMINALVRNARAKVIERRFLDVKNHMSRLFETFTGGNVLEKPEQLGANLKNGKPLFPSISTKQFAIASLKKA